MKLKVWPIFVGAVIITTIGLVADEPDFMAIGLFMYCLAASIELGKDKS